MPKYCQAPKCNQEHNDEVVYLQFPKCAQLKQKWLAAMSRPDYKPTPTSLICSNHFEETDFTYRFGKKTLRNGVIPTIFSGRKIENEGPQLKETNQKKTFYIPHYVLINRKFLNSHGGFNLENLNSDNLSAPVLYGIGNTSTLIKSPGVVTSPFLKRKKKNNETSQMEAGNTSTLIKSPDVVTKDEISQRSECDIQRNDKGSTQSKSDAIIKELREIHSYNKKPEDSSDSRNILRDDDEKEEVGCEEKEEGGVMGDEVVQEDKCYEIPSSDVLRSHLRYRRYRPGRFGDCSLDTFKKLSTSKIAWNLIQRTLDSQKKKIVNLQSEHITLLNQLHELEDSIKEITTSKK